jgi:hypothetical protein
VKGSDPSGPRVFWPAWNGASTSDAAPARWEFDAVPIYARALNNAQVESLLAASLGRWRPARTLVGENGDSCTIWESADGDLFLPFDPDEVILNYWSERYREIGKSRALVSVRRAAMRGYYMGRPFLPRPVQIAFRRALAQVQRRTAFPRWPTEPALHDLYGLLFEIFAQIASEPLPWIEFWPNGSTWAIVLTHDVETRAGCERIDVLKRIERRHEYRSSWNFVPRRYETPGELVQQLWDEGFEVGVHGLYHDGRDLQWPTFDERLPAMRAQGERWGARGFRSPATHRAWDLMPRLGFDYDSSSPDTDPFEPQAGGCCTWLPFFNQDLVELPITLVQDHTLFVLLRSTDEAVWVQKTEYLRERGGMALLLTHPDYMEGERELGAYERYLARFSEDAEVWRALPNEVSSWWRRRAASKLERTAQGWRVMGPAAGEARIATAPPP